MSASRSFGKIAAVAAIVLAPCATPVFAQNVNAMAKWTALTVVRYRVVGEFSGTTTILSGAKNVVPSTASVTDRVEIDFDWNQSEMKLVGKPVIRNFPTKVVALNPGPNCSVPKIGGTFELATFTAIDDSSMERMSGVLNTTVKRDQPGGSACGPSEAGTVWETAPAKSETLQQKFMVAQAMALAMPGMIPATPDGKSLVLKADGWTWTQTPTPVK